MSPSTMHLALSKPRRFFPLGSIIVILLAAGAQAETAPQRLQVDDLPAPFAAVQDRSEAEQDHIEALARYATARTYEQRGDFNLAALHFARAERLDPASIAARSSLVALAIDHKHYALAARYATKGIDPKEVGEEDLQLLGDYWLKQGDAARAIEFYEQSLLTNENPNDSEAARQAADMSVRLELGRLYSLLGKYATAAEQFARVRDVLDHPERFGVHADAVKSLLKIEPALLYETFGEAFLLADRLSDAEAAFRKSHALAANETVLDFNLARIAARRGHAQEALDKLQPYLDRDLTVEGMVPYQLLADVLKKLGKENELLVRLKKLHEADRANSALSYFLAIEYLKAGKLDLAEPLYVEMAAKGGTLAYPALAEIYRRSGRPDKLLALLGQVTSAAGTLEALGAEAKPLSTNGELFRSLAQAARKKIGSVPEKADYAEYLSLGILAQARKDYDTANEFFEHALKADPSKASEILLTWGIGSLLDERSAEAIKVFQRGLDLKATPNGNPIFQYYLAGALAADVKVDGKLDAALGAARLAAKSKPDSARFAGRVAWVLFRARRYDEARAAYEKLLEEFDSSEDSAETAFTLREARLALSSVCVTLGQMPEAEERLEQVLDEYPDDVEAHNDLGFLWADENKHLQRALKSILTAVAAEPDNRAYRDSLGWVFYRLGRTSEAVTELEKAVDEKQPDGTVLDHLGDAYAKAGKTEKARAAWRRGIDAFEKEREPEKAKKLAEKLGITK